MGRKNDSEWPDLQDYTAIYKYIKMSNYHLRVQERWAGERRSTRAAATATATTTTAATTAAAATAKPTR